MRFSSSDESSVDKQQNTNKGRILKTKVHSSPLSLSLSDESIDDISSGSGDSSSDCFASNGTLSSDSSNENEEIDVESNRISTKKENKNSVKIFHHELDDANTSVAANSISMLALNLNNECQGEDEFEKANTSVDADSRINPSKLKVNAKRKANTSVAANPK